MSGLELIGALAGAAGTVASGIASKNAADYQAEQQEAAGKEELAASQRDALEKKREANILNSRQLALAAASGAGAGSDAPTIVQLMSSTAGEGDYNARTSLYGGFSRKAGLNAAAAGSRMSGNASLLGGVLGGFGQAASAFGKYGKAAFG
jgi:hypothetical protein